MTGRCLDWWPLADSDPIGGDPDTVRTEGAYYSNLANEITDQVTRLRQIAGMDGLKGKAVDKLRSAAGDLADKLNQTVGRVETVGSELTAWVPELEHALSETAIALSQAIDAKHAMDANAPAPHGTPAPTAPADIQAAAARSTRHTHAANELAAATARFNNAVTARDQQAAVVAAKIKGALHDGLSDSWWDHISHWVSQHAELLKQLTEILGWIVTALAILCIFIPGLNLIVLAAALLLLAAHSILAATGNGSWADVALDVFTVATLGLGSVAARAAVVAREASLARAGTLASEDAVGAVNASRAITRTAIQDATRGMAKFGSLKSLGSYIYSRSLIYDAVTGWKAAGAGWESQMAMLSRELPDVTMLERAKAMGIETAKGLKDLKALTSLYGSDPEFAATAAQWEAKLLTMRRLDAVSAAVDGVNHAVSRSELPVLQPVLSGLPPWEHFKETVSFSVGQP